MTSLSRRRIDEAQMSTVLQKALRTPGLILESDSAVVFIDLGYLAERIRHLQSLFPSTTLHAVAVKANPLFRILEAIRAAGAGLEAASIGELALSTEAGMPPERIVYDSPVKTRSEIRTALQTLVHINADSILELDRMADIIACGSPVRSVGIRINPQVGTGQIAMTSVAGTYSKFGEPLLESRDALIDRFMRYPWLVGVHVHVGSQGCGPELLLSGVKRVLDFAADVRRRTSKDRIRIFDIGGGLPVSYHRDGVVIDMEGYSRALFERFPELQQYRLITEFGRWIHANTAWAASRIEYVKRSGDTRTAMIHVGADMFLRKCYRSDEWHHELTVVDDKGMLKTDRHASPSVVAGPLCFAGDVLARDVHLPDMAEGDYVLIHDVGAYTFSMWSRYNSRQLPKFIGYEDDGERFVVLKDRERLEDVCRFWK
ncbi:MAG: diaminopimelate decarboxylase [Thermodesulfobacteriota bacterium]